jgi:RNA polymerase sigma-70 factor, ECF subfamily
VSVTLTMTGVVMFTLTKPHIVVRTARKAPGLPATTLALGPTSDRSLIEAIGRGDRSAMAALYGRYNVRVYRFILRIVGNAAMAEDILSDVFLSVWQNAASFRSDSQVSTWLLAIARNRSYCALRRRSEEQLEDDEAEETEDLADTPEMALDKMDRSAVMRRCLSRLSADQRQVIDLVYYHDKSVTETAEITGVSINTVKTRMFYARQRMAKLLKEAGLEAAA